MKKFKYTSEDANGKTSEGTVEADSKDEAMAILARRDLIVKSIEELGEKGKDEKFQLKIPALSKAASLADLSNFCYELSALLNSGVPLPKALQLFITGEKNKTPFLDVVQDVLQNVRAGTALSAAIASHPDTFPPIFEAMCKAGEGTGTLDSDLDQLSIYFANVDRIRNQIISALIYPMVVVAVAFVILTGIFTYAVPKFTNIYEHLGVQLPFFTRILIDIGKNFHYFIYTLAALVILAAIPGYLYFNTEKGKGTLDAIKLKMPILGSIFYHVSIASFCKTLALLNANGVNLREAVSLSAHSSGNRYLISQFMKMEPALQEGKQLSQALVETGALPEQVIGMLEAGEKAGKLSQMLDKIADFTDNRTKQKIDRLMSLLEPALIVVIGFFVGVTIIALAGPIFQLPAEIHP